MPWFPDFVSAVELARRQTGSSGLADPVREYFNVLETGRTHELEEIWPGQVVIYDPREGEVRGIDSFDGLSATIDCCGLSATSASKPWPLRLSAGAPSSSCWRTWTTTAVCRWIGR